MARKRKITTGTNDRPVDETIAQSGGGLPDDTSRAPPGGGEKQRARLRESLDAGRKPATPSGDANPDAVPEGTHGAGEDICRRCRGNGRIGGETCPECGGSGKVTTPLAGG
ncbi:hypothetical protein [Chelativorans sp. M5D2P16]|uniref:hypothetical protein n=1 Tax=Chelativorans sp. M5D2P16 TaxID=3095678 RepID=UPI002ACA1C2D|nr:hypothetical protein [Chelativorans sp. M5D2P16]MDZ5697693.1 hypothetical protein [Chelativorans sp. M5D2P16]